MRNKILVIVEIRDVMSAQKRVPKGDAEEGGERRENRNLEEDVALGVGGGSKSMVLYLWSPRYFFNGCYEKLCSQEQSIAHLQLLAEGSSASLL